MKKKILKLKKTVKKNLKSPKKPAKGVRVKERKKEKVEIPAREIALFNLKAPAGAHKRRKYLGRGPSSGHGKTSTRGSKGQTSRAGRDFYLGFEGGQTPLIRRIPKRGFTNKFKKEYQIVNLSDLNRIKESTITPQLLEEKGIIKDKQKKVKVLGDGSIQNPISVAAHAFSKRALDQIQKAGGKIEVINV
jgi:large subunit ribosomal protein L15